MTRSRHARRGSPSLAPVLPPDGAKLPAEIRAQSCLAVIVAAGVVAPAALAATVLTPSSRGSAVGDCEQAH